MHKRILSLLLAAVLMLSLIPAFALPSGAVSNMKMSEACIAILKELEGFSKFAYFDYSHYSIGYGSSCKPEDYPDGITEEQADKLLREFVSDMEEDLNRFAGNCGIIFPQYQFDALMLFTYNVGTGWMFSDSDIRQAVIDNARGNDFIYPFTLWSAAGGNTHMGLVNRRLMEANMYLNGSYSRSRPANYTYVKLDNNGGEGMAKIHGYDCNLEAPMKAVPTREGYIFLGWYSEAEGGSWISSLKPEHSQKTVYAHWQPQNGTPETAAAVSYEIPTSALVSLDTCDVPGGAVTGTLIPDAMVIVAADFVDASGTKWGRMSTGQWVKLGHPLVGISKEDQVEQGLKVSVTGDIVNVRTGPGTNYPVIAGVWRGDVIGLTRVVSVEDVLWGRFRAGWICLEYTDYSGGLPVEAPTDIPDIPATPQAPKKSEKPSNEIIATGTVTANQIFIRSVAGSRGTPQGSYTKGERVKLFEKVTVSGTTWGRTKLGWINLTYVKLDGEIVMTLPDPTAPEYSGLLTGEKKQAGSEKATVISTTGLNIRSGPGTGYSIAGSYKPGQSIRIREQIAVRGVAWGKTMEGWVCMQYVHLPEDDCDEIGISGKIYGTDSLDIRSGAGVAYMPVGTYASGTEVRIFEQVSISGRKWGRTDQGWVCMDYVRLAGADGTIPQWTQPETTPTEASEQENSVPEKGDAQPEAEITGTVAVEAMNIRRNPGTDAEIVGSYSRGNRVTILETKQVNGSTWGRTNRGWISLMYVQLENPQMEENGFTGTVIADTLCIRKGPGNGNVILGFYRNGETVTIREQVRVGITLWGRTDRGWICMDYVQ